MAFAESTKVSPEKTKAEIESTLQRHGAGSFGSGYQGNRIWVMFTMKNRNVRFTMNLPDPKDRRFTHTASRNTPRSSSDALAEWEQGCRSVWRKLLLCIKAKIESVESGIESFEEAFLAQIVLPTGENFGDWAVPQIHQAYLNRGAPEQLALGPAKVGGS